MTHSIIRAGFKCTMDEVEDGDLNLKKSIGFSYSLFNVIKISFPDIITKSNNYILVNFINGKRASLACAARLADTVCP